MLRGALPVFVRVTAWAALVVPTFWLLKVRLDVDKLAAGVPPTPDRLTVCALPAAMLRMARLPVSVPAAVGEGVAIGVEGSHGRRIDLTRFSPPKVALLRCTRGRHRWPGP